MIRETAVAAVRPELVHGKSDLLLPCTETLRMERALAGVTDVRARGEVLRLV